MAQYSSRLLPWYYALSAFWVGQAGSLLFWAWLVGVLAMVYRFWPRRTPSPLREPALAILMAYQCFLVAMMVFGADPMQPSLIVPAKAAGSVRCCNIRRCCCTRPCVPRLCRLRDPLCPGRRGAAERPLDAAWIREARPWAFFAWAVLGIGILVGGYWAYEELGWGGYWNWDPVENGSLIPWLTATALIHAAMAYRQRGGLKRTTLLLAVATFAACNFAAFLTRSGIFSSLHAFSQSPIGWMFLLLIVVLLAGAAVLLVRRRVAMSPRTPLSGLWAKESVATASVFVLILLAAAVFLGTVSLPRVASILPAQGPRRRRLLQRRADSDGPAVAGGDGRRAAAALGRAAGATRQVKALLLAAGVGLLAAGLAWLGGLRHPLAMAVVGSGSHDRDGPGGILGVGRPPGSRTASSAGLARRAPQPAANVRRLRYAPGLACLAVGVAGSSLGTRQHEATLPKGESIHWAGRDIRFVGLVQRRFPRSWSCRPSWR